MDIKELSANESISPLPKNHSRESYELYSI